MKPAGSILIPLILSSMELWGFGKGTTRTWYSGSRYFYPFIY